VTLDPPVYGSDVSARTLFGIDPFTPVWNLFDLLRSGRDDWMPRHFYE
jgi:hypothetical protein